MEYGAICKVHLAFVYDKKAPLSLSKFCLILLNAIEQDSIYAPIVGNFLSAAIIQERPLFAQVR